MKKFLILIALVALGTVGWYLGSPLFIDTVVYERFPMTEEDKTMMHMLEDLTVHDVEAMSKAQQEEMKKMMEDIGEKMPDTVLHDSMPTTKPVVHASGSFRDADDFHKGSGTASLYRLPDGSHVLRFEDFSVTNGPGLRVYLTKDTSGSTASGFADLGKLKGNKGSQNYSIPSDVDVNTYNAVLIYCAPFAVPFAVAPLQ